MENCWFIVEKRMWFEPESVNDSCIPHWQWRYRPQLEVEEALRDSNRVLNRQQTKRRRYWSRQRREGRWEIVPRFPLSDEVGSGSREGD